MKTRAWPTLLVSAAAGTLVWVLSPLLTGHREPWDAGGLFYVVALIVAASLAGLLAPKPIWAHYLGALVGQLAYEVLFLRVGPLFALGVAFLAGYCLIFAGAAAVTGYLRLRWEKARIRSGG